MDDIVNEIEKYDTVILQTEAHVYIVCNCSVSFSVPEHGTQFELIDNGVWKITARSSMRCTVFKGAECNEIRILVRRDFGFIHIYIVVPYTQKKLFIDAREGQHPSIVYKLIDCYSQPKREKTRNWPPSESLN